MVHVWEYGNYFFDFQKSSQLMFCAKCIYIHVFLMGVPNITVKNYCGGNFIDSFINHDKFIELTVLSQY